MGLKSVLEFLLQAAERMSGLSAGERTCSVPRLAVFLGHLTAESKLSLAAGQRPSVPPYRAQGGNCQLLCHPSSSWERSVTWPPKSPSSGQYGGAVLMEGSHRATRVLPLEQQQDMSLAVARPSFASSTEQAKLGP